MEAFFHKPKTRNEKRPTNHLGEPGEPERNMNYKKINALNWQPVVEDKCGGEHKTRQQRNRCDQSNYIHV